MSPRLKRAQTVLHHAHGFLRSNDILRTAADVDQQPVGIILPMLTMQAFAIELLLKCLILIDDADPPYVHKLKQLFDLLASETRDEVVRRWDEGPRKKIEQIAIQFSFSSDLPSSLEACGDAFVQLRYAFDKPEKLMFHLDGLPIVLVDVIALKQPNFVVWVDDI
jgi:hypothetical protein